jgi:signal transduction histidine kinase
MSVANRGVNRRLLSFAVYLAAGYLAVYAICTVIMLYLGNRVITQSTRSFDRQDVRAETEELTELLENNPKGNWLAEEIALERLPPSTIFAIRILSTLGHVEYEARTPRNIVIPGWERTMRGPVLFPHLGWDELKVPDSERIIQLQTTQLSDGRILQIAKGSLLESKQKQMMSRNMKLFMFFSLALTLFATILMIFITLRPIEQITKSMRNIIETGAFESNPPPVRSMISELNSLSAQFNIMTQKYATLIQAMRETMDNVAHDIRTPLARIRGASELAIKLEDIPEHLTETLASIIEDCDHTQLQLKNLLDTREMESGFVKINCTQFDLSNILKTLCDMYSLIAEEKNISLNLETPPDAVLIEADRNRVARIFSNIIDNALKYTEPQGRVDVKLNYSDDVAEVTVVDTGIGISPDEISLIWQRLYRGEAARAKSRGLGLGMNIVKTFIEAHQGRVQVQSSEKGTLFRVRLPLKQSS